MNQARQCCSHNFSYGHNGHFIRQVYKLLKVEVIIQIALHKLSFIKTVVAQ